MQDLMEEILAVPEVRYVAVYREGTLLSREKTGVANASASESDKYEELIVNPTLLKLLQQRGNIDCGGAQFVIIRYGNFWQLIRPIDGGHISVAVDVAGDPLRVQRALELILAGRRLLTKAAGN